MLETHNPQPTTDYADSIDARATFAERASDNLRNGFLDLAADLGTEAIGRSVDGFERLLDAAGATDTAGQEIDRPDDAARFAQALEALGRYQTRLMHAEARGAAQQPLKAGKRKTLAKKAAKAAGASDEQVQAWLSEPPLIPEHAEFLTQARLYGRLLGRERLNAEAQAQLPSAFARLDEPGVAHNPQLATHNRIFQSDSGFDDFRVDPVAAIQAARQRRAVGPDKWKAMTGQERAAAFSYSYAPNYQLVQRARTLINEAVAEGGTYEEFRHRMAQEYGRMGLAPMENWYAETIFRTNVLSAYGRGRWEQIMQPGMESYFPYLRFVTAGDESVRPEHAILEGVYRRDDDFWATHWPPLDFNCRCSAQVVSEGRLKERGWQVLDGGQKLRTVPEGYLNRIAAAQGKGFGNTEAWAA